MPPSPLGAPTGGGGSRTPPQPYKVLRPGGVSPGALCSGCLLMGSASSWAQVRGAAAAETQPPHSGAHIPASDAGPAPPQVDTSQKGQRSSLELRQDPGGKGQKQERLSWTCLRGLTSPAPGASEPGPGWPSSCRALSSDSQVQEPASGASRASHPPWGQPPSARGPRRPRVGFQPVSPETHHWTGSLSPHFTLSSWGLAPPLRPWAQHRLTHAGASSLCAGWTDK